MKIYEVELPTAQQAAFVMEKGAFRHVLAPSDLGRTGDRTLQLSERAVEVLTALDPKSDGYVDRAEDGELRLWMDGRPHPLVWVSGGLLSTSDAAHVAKMEIRGFRKLASRARKTGVELQAPRRLWPDQRSPRYDEAALRRYLDDPRLRPGRGRRSGQPNAAVASGTDQ
jgi:hypothetical protein